MKNLLSIIVLLCLTQQQSTAQDGFAVKASGPHLFNLPEDLVIKPDGNVFFMFSSIPESSSTTYTNEIYELNPFGEIVNTYTFADTQNDYVEYTNCLIVEDSLYVFGWRYKTIGVNSYYPCQLMHKFDLQLNLISSHEIWLDQLSPSIVEHGRIKYKDGIFYSGNSFKGYGIPPLLYKNFQGRRI